MVPLLKTLPTDIVYFSLMFVYYLDNRFVFKIQFCTLSTSSHEISFICRLIEDRSSKCAALLIDCKI